MNSAFRHWHRMRPLAALPLLAFPLATVTLAQEVQNPGVLVHAADDEPTTLDPAQVEPGEGGETVILQVYERLLEFGPSGPDLVPALATEVPTHRERRHLRRRADLHLQDPRGRDLPRRQPADGRRREILLGPGHDHGPARGQRRHADRHRRRDDGGGPADVPGHAEGAERELPERRGRGDGRLDRQPGGGRGEWRRRGRRAERVHGDQHGRHRPLQVQHLEPRPRTSRSTSTRTTGATRRISTSASRSAPTPTCACSGCSPASSTSSRRTPPSSPTSKASRASRSTRRACCSSRSISAST